MLFLLITVSPLCPISAVGCWAGWLVVGRRRGGAFVQPTGRVLVRLGRGGNEAFRRTSNVQAGG
jgi:hypothetical protein